MDEIDDHEVRDGEGEDTNNETNSGVEKGVFGFLDFLGIAGRSHEVDAADDHEDDADSAKHGDDAVDDAGDKSNKIVFTTTYGVYVGASVADELDNHEVDDDKGKSTDGKTDTGIHDGVFGFLDFVGVAGGSHEVDAADHDENDGDGASDGDDAVDDALNDFGKFGNAGIYVGTARGLADFFWNITGVANIAGADSGGGMSETGGESD